MPDIDEKRIDNLEKKITKIEEYIKCCEQSKLHEKLESIKGDIILEIKKQNKSSAKNSQLIAVMNIGIVAVVFSSRFQGFNLTTGWALALFIIGIGAYIYCWSQI